MLGTNAELDFIFADLGVPVVFGGVTVYGDVNTGPIQMVDAVSGEISLEERRTTITIRDGSLAGLVVDAAIEAGGVSYLIRDPGFAKSDGTRTLAVVPG